MAISITTAPSEFAWLYNPIAVVLLDASGNFKRFLYKVTVASVDSELYESLREADNTATLDLSALLRKFFDIGAYPLPDLTDADIELQANQTSLIKPYTLTASTQYTSGADSTQTATANVLWGGLAYTKKNADTLLTGSTENTYPALTTFFTKKTTPEGKEFLNFANIFLASNPSSFILKTVFFDENGNNIQEQSITITAINKGKTTLIDASYAKIVAPYTAEKVYKYTLKIEASVGLTNYYSPTYQFDVDYNYYPQTSEFLYINSRGGLSTIRFVGEREDEQNTTRENISRYISPLANLPTSAIYSRVNISEESFEISTGYFETWEDFRQVQDLFLSQGIWEIVGTTLIPVELLTKKLPTYNSDKTTFASAKLEFKYLMSNFL